MTDRVSTWVTRRCVIRRQKRTWWTVNSFLSSAKCGFLFALPRSSVAHADPLLHPAVGELGKHRRGSGEWVATGIDVLGKLQAQLTFECLCSPATLYRGAFSNTATMNSNVDPPVATTIASAFSRHIERANITLEREGYVLVTHRREFGSNLSVQARRLNGHAPIICI
jgi:hypothetical protein